MARALRVVALLLAVAAAAAAAASASSATAAPARTPRQKVCDPRLLAGRVLSSCTPAFATRRQTCCDALLSAVPRGGAAVRCICYAAQEEELRLSGVTSIDLLLLYNDCGGALPSQPREVDTLCQDNAAPRRRLGAPAKCDATVVAWNISTECSEPLTTEGAQIPQVCCELVRLAGDTPYCLCDAAQDPALLDSPISLEHLHRTYTTCGGIRRVERCWPLEPASFTTPTAPAHTPEQTRSAPRQPQQSHPDSPHPQQSPKTMTAPVPLQPEHASSWAAFWGGISGKIVEFVGLFLAGFAALVLGWMAENWFRRKLARGQLDAEREREAEAARMREREEVEVARAREAEAARAREREEEAKAAKEREREAEAAKKKERRAARKAARARRAAREAARMLVEQKMLHAQKVFAESGTSSSSSADSSSTSSSSSARASTEYTSC